MQPLATATYPIYEQLKTLLDEKHARYREVEHASCGRSEEVAQARGTTLEQGAKAMVVRAKISNSARAYYLAVYPSDLQLDMNKLASTIKINVKNVGFAQNDAATKLTQCVMNAVPPFSFNSELKLLVDKKVLQVDEIAFNAARLDKSIILNTEDYLKIVGVEPVDISTSRD